MPHGMGPKSRLTVEGKEAKKLFGKSPGKTVTATVTGKVREVGTGFMDENRPRAEVDVTRVSFGKSEKQVRRSGRGKGPVTTGPSSSRTRRR